jgi:hypothetical protein
MFLRSQGPAFADAQMSELKLRPQHFLKRGSRLIFVSTAARSFPRDLKALLPGPKSGASTIGQALADACGIVRVELEFVLAG